ncbi:MAG: hypothetical protein ACTS6G_03670 [Candidatus Hodgkinia cicadicola]
MSRNLPAAALASLSSIPDSKVNLKSTSVPRRTPLVPQSILTSISTASQPLTSLRTIIQQASAPGSEHGSGKSTLTNQVCSKLNWPCVRLNLDEHLTKLGFTTSAPAEVYLSLCFKYGLLPWAMKRPLVLILNASGALKPEAMIMLNKLLKTKCTFLRRSTAQQLTQTQVSVCLRPALQRPPHSKRPLHIVADGNWSQTYQFEVQISLLIRASSVLKLKAVNNSLRKLKTKQL